MPRMRPVLFGAVLAVAVAVSGACGSDRSGGPHGSPTDVVLRGIDRTQALGRARLQIGIGEVAAGTGEVVWDQSGARVALHLHLVRAAAAANGQATREEVVIVGPNAYVEAAATGHQWIHGTSAELSRRLDASAPELASVLARPAAGLDLDSLRGATSVLSYGGAEVRGASTLRYTVRISPAQAAQAASGPAASDLAPLVDGQAASYPTDVWIDAGRRILRIQLPRDPRATVTTLSEDSVAFGVTTIDLLDFGAPVTVSVPSGAG